MSSWSGKTPQKTIVSKGDVKCPNCSKIMTPSKPERNIQKATCPRCYCVFGVSNVYSN